MLPVGLGVDASAVDLHAHHLSWVCGRNSNIWRLVKDSQKEHGQLKAEFFLYREDLKPPEDYVSFYHSDRIGVKEQLAHAIALFPLKVKKNSWVLSLDMDLAHKVINKKSLIVKFTEQGYPHIGLEYVVEDSLQRMTAVGVLLLMSDRYAKDEDSGEFFLLAE